MFELLLIVVSLVCIVLGIIVLKVPKKALRQKIGGRLTRFAISMVIILIGSLAVWFGGWFLWDLANLWRYLLNYEYEELLVLSILAWIIGGLVMVRHHGLLSQNISRKKRQKTIHKPKLQEDVTSLIQIGKNLQEWMCEKRNI